ncbi:hypothetical protein ACQKOH_05535 [Sphingomonas sp. NPDC092331]|jgi:hypothetical protein|uniref:hypothetical protein n=1 Tax=unclassified Sphingomonas TaxID=196159 RepID=UPI0029F143C2|nr:hypothetical protein [Pseudomonadota bacterium]
MLLKTLIGAAALLAAPAAFAQTTSPTDPSAMPPTEHPAPAPAPDPSANPPAPAPDATTAAPAPDPAAPSHDPATSEDTDKRGKKDRKKPH